MSQFLISNNIRVKEPNSKIIDYCNKVLTLDNPNFIQAEKLGRETRFIPRKIKLYAKNGKDLILPFGTLQDLWKLKDKGTLYSLDFSPLKPLKLVGSISLYDYQNKAVESLIQGKNGILKAPCGSGKTQMGIALIKRLGYKALWLTHTHDLLTQSKARCERYFKGSFGTITQGKVNIGSDITFATVQTLSKVDPSLYANEFNVIVIDECHRCVGTPTQVTMFYKVLNQCKARYKFGLSATLDRADGLINSLYAIIGNVLHEVPRKCVADKVIKAKYEVIENNKEYDPFDYISNSMINYNALITLLSEDEERDEIIIDNVMKHLDRDQLILCHRVQHVERLGNILKENGVECNVVTGKVKNREFNEKVIIATYSLAKEGLDIPRLDILHLATPQKNKSTTVQSVGRIERNIEGKKQPICFDYLDTDIEYCEYCQNERRKMITRR